MYLLVAMLTIPFEVFLSVGFTSRILNNILLKRADEDFENLYVKLMLQSPTSPSVNDEETRKPFAQYKFNEPN